MLNFGKKKIDEEIEIPVDLESPLKELVDFLSHADFNVSQEPGTYCTLYYIAKNQKISISIAVWHTSNKEEKIQVVITDTTNRYGINIPYKNCLTILNNIFRNFTRLKDIAHEKRINNRDELINKFLKGD